MNESRSRFSKKISGRTQGNGMFKWFMLFVYIVLCSYVFTGWFRWRKWMEIPHWKIVSIGIAFLLLLLASSIFLGKFLPQSEIQLKILQFGNYWIGFLIYVISFILACDLIWLLRSLLAFKWSWMGGPLIRTKTGVILLAVLVLGGSFLSTLYGAVHAKKIKTSFHDITINKQVDDLKEMKVVLIADLHLGYSVGSKDMQKMVDRINKQDPDLVVLAGDIFDNEYDALDDPDQLVKIFRQLKSQYGVYAVYGNHDIDEKILAGFTFGSGREKKVSDPRMDEFVKRAGMKLLRDESVCIDQSFYLYGRPDAEKVGRGISRRKTPKELVNGMDLKKPVIVLDHEPRQLEELNQAGVDLDLCGHTHDGQLFPGNITIHLFWKNPYGYRKVGNAHQIVTSGVGLFGPNMRVGTKAEIVVVNVDFR